MADTSNPIDPTEPDSDDSHTADWLALQRLVTEQRQRLNEATANAYGLTSPKKDHNSTPEEKPKGGTRVHGTSGKAPVMARPDYGPPMSNLTRNALHLLKGLLEEYGDNPEKTRSLPLATAPVEVLHSWYEKYQRDHGRRIPRGAQEIVDDAAAALSSGHAPLQPAYERYPAAGPKPRLPARWLLRFRVFGWLAKHPKTHVGSAIGVLLFAFSTQLGGAPKIALACYFTAWITWCFVIYISAIWRRTRVASIALMTLPAVMVFSFWWALLPEKEQQFTPDEYADAVWKRAPAPIEKTAPEAVPNLDIRLGQAVRQYNRRLKLTEFLLEVEIRNSGKASAVTGWIIRYSSPTLDKMLNPVQPLAKPMIFPLSKQKDAVLLFNYPTDAINEKVAAAPVTQELPVTGRLLLNIPGDRGDEIGAGVALLTVVISDYKGKLSTAHWKGGGEQEKLNILPNEKVAPATRQQRKRFIN